MTPEVAVAAGLAGLGRATLARLAAVGDFTRFALDALRLLVRRGIPLRETLRQFESISVRSSPIVLVTYQSVIAVVTLPDLWNGLAKTLVFEPYDGTGVDELRASLAGVEAIVTEIRAGDGLLHRPIYEPFEDHRVVEDLSATTASLQRILDKIEKGEGTLGLLSNDPTVFEDLQTVLGSARRSRLLRSMIRMSVDENAKAAGEPWPRPPGRDRRIAALRCQGRGRRVRFAALCELHAKHRNSTGF